MGEHPPPREGQEPRGEIKVFGVVFFLSCGTSFWVEMLPNWAKSGFGASAGVGSPRGCPQ